jgi:hypothetical protein
MGFNKQWANKHSKAEFIKQHKHHADKFDLGGAWEDLQEKRWKAKVVKDGMSPQSEYLSHAGNSPLDGDFPR